MSEQWLRLLPTVAAQRIELGVVGNLIRSGAWWSPSAGWWAWVMRLDGPYSPDRLQVIQCEPFTGDDGE